MRRDLAYQRLFAATTPFRARAYAEHFTPSTPSCSCCSRRWSDVEAPFQAASYSYGKSGQPEQVCLTCYTLRIPSEEMLGLERYNKTGNTVTSIYGKLGMLVGSGGIITPTNTLYVTLPPKLFEKYRDGKLGQAGQLSTEKPLARLLALLASGELNPLEKGFVYIENWGRKADVLLRNLRPTLSLQEVWCNSEQGTTPLNVAAMLKTASVLVEQGLEKNAAQKTFWWPITAAAGGQRNPQAFEEWVKKVPDPHALLSVLPDDPFDRQKLPTVLREIMPHLPALKPYINHQRQPTALAALEHQEPSLMPQQGSLF